MGEIVVYEGSILVAHPSELLLNGPKFFVRHVIERDQASSCSFNAAQELVELQGDNSRLSVLGVLDEKHHLERNNVVPVLITSCQVSE